VSRSFEEAVPDKQLIDPSSVDVDDFIVASRKKGNAASTVALKVMWVKTWLELVCRSRQARCRGRQQPQGHSVLRRQHHPEGGDPEASAARR